MAKAKIWIVKTDPLIPVVNSNLIVKIAIKNIGNTGNTLWIGAKKNNIIKIQKNTFGVPPGEIFKWFTIDCGTYNGDPININIEAGHGWQKEEIDDTFISYIDENGIDYSAGDDEPDPGYELTTYVVGEGAVERDPPGSYYLQGTEVNLRAVKQSDWNFKLWMEGDKELGTQNPIKITMDKDRDITAVYTQESDLPVYNNRDLKLRLLNVARELIDIIYELE